MLFSKNRRAIIIGCGTLGATIANTLCEKNYQVTIVDKSEKSFAELSPNFSGFTKAGDGTNLEFLELIEIRKASLVVAVTDDDNANSLIGQIACKICKVPEVIIRFADAKKEHLIEGYPIKVIYPFDLMMDEFKRIIEEEI